MAKLYHSFLDFNKSIKLSSEDRKKLLTNRESLRNRMRENYKKLPEEARRALDMRFQSQGSYVMDTIIKPLSEDYDLDDGVYFIGTEARESRQNPEVFHEWVKFSVDQDVSYEKVTDKDTCVRVAFKNKSHIDLPIYYFIQVHPDLAHKKHGWMVSDPIEFIQWFETKAKSGFESKYLIEYASESEHYKTWLNDMRKADSQIRRLVRYLKGWADFVGGPMPCGLILSILVAENYAPDERDDLSLKNTLNNIFNVLRSNNVQCCRPTTPVGEELFAHTSIEDKTYFMEKLRSFLYDAEAAINANQVRLAADYWGRQLGSRFVLSENDRDLIDPIPPRQYNLGQTITEKPWYPNNQ
jgi:Second Messenger Oligonucleotide or Dinucleotide Synthetase domain